MTLPEISHLLLTELRAGRVSDDEDIDIRVLNELVHIKRALFIKNEVNKGRPVAMSWMQSFEVPLDYIGSNFLVSNTIPKFIEANQGPLINEITSIDKTILPFSIVPYSRLRFVGNGRFNKDFLYVSWIDDKLYFNSGEPQHKLLEKCNVRGVIANPTEVTGYNIDTSEYPISNGLVEYIKNSMFDTDFRAMLTAISDDINDADGKIKQL